MTSKDHTQLRWAEGKREGRKIWTLILPSLMQQVFKAEIQDIRCGYFSWTAVGLLGESYDCTNDFESAKELAGKEILRQVAEIVARADAASLA